MRVGHHLVLTISVSSSDAASLPIALFEVTLTLKEVSFCGIFTEIPKVPEKVVCTINVDKSNCQVSRCSSLLVVG